MNFASKEEVEKLIEDSPKGDNTKFLSSSHSLWFRFKNYEKNPEGSKSRNVSVCTTDSYYKNSSRQDT